MTRLQGPNCPECGAASRTKKYVGGQGTYQQCRGCGITFGGEESAAKRALIQGAAETDPGEFEEWRYLR